METTDRKKDHIELTEESKTLASARDSRFFYEPVMSAHPKDKEYIPTFFLGKPMNAPIWVSSMTGGTAMAKQINENLARVCNEFKLGMGLGSCRKLLFSNDHIGDFDMRKHIGEQPFYANLGIAQIVELVNNKHTEKIVELVKKLQADGLIIHVNPTQEWLQPEGDRIHLMSPYEGIKRIVENLSLKVIIKEVGQGMGPESLKAILQLPVEALEFGAFGGTNFSKMESLRDPKLKSIDPVCMVGHTADEMIDFIHQIEKSDSILCRQFIVSGGIKNYLDGYYYNERLCFNSVYGQAAGFLRYAKEDYDTLAQYVESQINGYKYAMRFLRVKSKAE